MLYLSQLVPLDMLDFSSVSANVNADFQAPFMIRENKREKLIIDQTKPDKKTDYRFQNLRKINGEICFKTTVSTCKRNRDYIYRNFTTNGRAFFIQVFF